MKKLFALSALALMLMVSGCAEKQAAATPAAPSAQSAAQSEKNATQAAKKDITQGTKLAMQVAGKSVNITLADNAATKRLLEQLPTDLEFKDFNNTEKIAYPKNKINVDGAPKGHAPKAGDMCIYVPWGNICIFYHDYKYSSDLVYLGSVEQGLDTLSSQTTDFTATLAVIK